jgi:hypothetical protein
MVEAEEVYISEIKINLQAIQKMLRCSKIKILDARTIEAGALSLLKIQGSQHISFGGSTNNRPE